MRKDCTIIVSHKTAFCGFIPNIIKQFMELFSVMGIVNNLSGLA